MDYFVYKIPKKIPKPVIWSSTIAASIGIACIIKEWAGGKRYPPVVDAKNKVIVITGANTGIGKETAWELARRDAKVYMACRDMRKCEETREEIVLDTQNKYVYCKACDLASLESIDNFVKEFNQKEEKIDVLINNAGVMRVKEHTKTKDGFEMQLGVNHLGHFYLTNLLMPKLKASVSARIINVSSVAHLRGTINKEDLNFEKKYDPGNAYAQSKLANVLFTKELSKQLANTNITVNAVHPGLVDTAIIRHMSFFNSWFSAIFLKPLVWPFIKSPRQGCQTIVYLALDPDLDKVTGQYFKDYEVAETSPLVQDETLAKWLWLVSEKWTRSKFQPV